MTDRELKEVKVKSYVAGTNKTVDLNCTKLEFWKFKGSKYNFAWIQSYDWEIENVKCTFNEKTGSKLLHIETENDRVVIVLTKKILDAIKESEK